MKRHLRPAAALFLLAALLPGPADARVVRPAPDVALAPGSKPASIKGIRNQPVVILFARSPRDRHFRSQVRSLEPLYRLFAARGVLFVAAFEQPGDGTIQSSIPFLVASNGAAAAAAYGLSPRGIAIVAPDGNLDLVSSRVTDGRRVREVLLNSQGIQAAHRK